MHYLKHHLLLHLSTLFYYYLNDYDKHFLSKQLRIREHAVANKAHVEHVVSNCGKDNQTTRINMMNEIYGSNKTSSLAINIDKTAAVQPKTMANSTQHVPTVCGSPPRLQRKPQSRFQLVKEIEIYRSARGDVHHGLI